MSDEIVCGECFGGLRARVVTESVKLSEASYRAREKIPPHYHLRAQICLVLNGDYRETYRGTSFTGKRGVALYHAPGEAHENQFGDRGGVCFHVDLAPGLLPWAAREGGTLETGFSRQAVPSWRVFQLREELRHWDDASPLLVEELAIHLFTDLLGLPGLAACSPPAWLEAVRERVHEGFRTPPTLAELAEGCGVHRITVAHAFRSHFRCTVGSYIRQRRVQVALDRLMAGQDLSVAAYSAGFADQSHFTRTFRRIVGITPGKFRRRFVQPDDSGRAAG